MLVSRAEFKSVVKKLSAKGQYGLDTETTGLREEDRLFSVILADEDGGYYFNFNSRPDHLGCTSPEEVTLPTSWIEDLQPIFDNENSLFFLHNAKFDLGMLAKEGGYVLGKVHDTEVVDRALHNNYIGKKPYSLDSVARRRGFEKDGRVDEYIEEHGLFDKLKIPGKDKAAKLKHFELIPFSLMSEYGTNDAIITRAIGLLQLKEIEMRDATRPANRPAIGLMIRNEYDLTQTCFRMEQAGIHINRAYTERALTDTQQSAARAMQDFEAMTGIPYADSATVFVKAFDKFGIRLPQTPTGKPCTNKAVLDALENPVADKIREIRGYQKLGSTYYSSFLYFADSNDMVHANVRQVGAETLRFSYSDPNLQNLPKEDEPEDEHKNFLVRRCFTPPSDEWIYVPIDFKQQEYRMLADYAGEHQLIQAILAGEDVHEATARMLGITRKQAKTLNFGLLYGMGPGKLARALRVPYEEACRLRAKYFERLPAICAFRDQVMSYGAARGYVYNWAGMHLNISEPGFAYVLPNHIIQSGCAMVIRQAMPLVDAYIRRHRLRTRIVVQVHDELLFQVHRSEIHHVPEFQRIMESVYQPKNGMRLDCSVEHSFKSFAKWDMLKGLPDGKAA